jgi:hypothetical protein
MASSRLPLQMRDLPWGPRLYVAQSHSGVDALSKACTGLERHLLELSTIEFRRQRQRFGTLLLGSMRHELLGSGIGGPCLCVLQ